jgi:hypothetical protein
MHCRHAQQDKLGAAQVRTEEPPAWLKGKRRHAGRGTRLHALRICECDLVQQDVAAALGGGLSLSAAGVDPRPAVDDAEDALR